MPIRVNETELYYEKAGSGEPLVLVHGSWVDHSSWALVAPSLAEDFRVITYDRRGHSRSERVSSQGSVHEDAADLAALLEALDAAPAHVVTSSFGGVIAMRLAVSRPELIRTLTMHEPPALDLLTADPESASLLELTGQRIGAVAAKVKAGDHEGAARQFVEEVALGPGAWETQVPPQTREIFIRNAPTFLDEVRDPDPGVDLDGLASFSRPTLVSDGTESPPVFPKIVGILADTIPGAQRTTYDGASHAPHLTHPEELVAQVRALSSTG